MKNIRKFSSVAEYNSALDSIKELDSYLALTIGEDGEPILERKMPEKIMLRAICFTSDGDVNISLCCHDVYPYLETSKDGINWNQWTDADGDDIYEPISLSEGEKLYVRGDNPDGIGYIDNESYIYKFVTFEMYCDDTVKVSCTGNIMHLISYEEDLTEIKQAWFVGMFLECTSLVNAPELPAKTLGKSCYDSMFFGCTNLVNAPALPATILADGCYGDMFLGCTSLVKAPTLPATTLAYMCYYEMFYECASLVTAPELPATELAESCYSRMFSGCTSLVKAPALPATELADWCYSCMFRECTSLVKAPVLPTTTLAY